MDDDAFKKRFRDVMARVMYSKVVVTESLKTPRGDFFVGLSAQVTQNDFGGMGADAMASRTDDLLSATQGIPFRDEPIVRLMVGRQAALAVHEQAFLCGVLPEEEYQARVRYLHRSFNKAIANLKEEVPK